MQTELFSMSTPAAYAAMAALLGRPITRCPPARACALSAHDILDLVRAHLPPRPRTADDDTYVLAVLPRPYVPKGPNRSRRAEFYSKNYRHFVVGRTLARVYAAGCSRRAVARARAEGWLIVGRRP